MFIPYRVDVPMRCAPVANWALIGVTVTISVGVLLGSFSARTVTALVLPGTNMYSGSAFGWLGHMFVHGDWLHLFGNMIFLWVFGNAVCARLGNLAYAGAYFGLGLVAALGHRLIDGSPMIGASGAINGVVGLFFIFYPFNNMSVLYWLYSRAGTFEIASLWMILSWLVFDIFGGMVGGDRVAHWAHLGGFFGGGAIAVGLLLTRVIVMDRGEKSLLAMFKLQPQEDRPRDTVSTQGPTRDLGHLDDNVTDSDETLHAAPPRSRMPSTAAMPLPSAWRGRSGGRMPAVAPSTVEAATGPSREAAAPAAPSVVTDERISVTCACGRTLRVDARHAGKRGRCPACQASLHIPG